VGDTNLLVISLAHDVDDALSTSDSRDWTLHAEPRTENLEADRMVIDKAVA
jgi:hypothetical protein